MKTEEKEIFGIKFCGTIHSWEDNFDMEQFESDSATLVSKQTYHHEDDMTFDFKMVIQAEYCEGAIFYSLYLVPTPEYINKEKLDDIMDFCGVESVDEIRYDDIIAYGDAVLFCNERQENTEDVDEDILNLIACIVDYPINMRGFYLDRAQNRIGTTGWEVIDAALNGGSPFDKAMKRIAENQ